MPINPQQLDLAAEFENELKATEKFDAEQLELIHELLLKVLQK